MSTIGSRGLAAKIHDTILHSTSICCLHSHRHYEQLLADHNSCDYFITVHNAYAIHFNDDKSGPRFNINQSIVLIEMYRSGKLSIQPCEACGSNIVTDCNQFAICPFAITAKRPPPQMVRFSLSSHIRHLIHIFPSDPIRNRY